MVATLTHEMSTTRQAIRFLMDQKAGLLFSVGREDRDPAVTRVFYAMDQSGALVAYLPRQSWHADILRHGGRTTLTVEGEERMVPSWLTTDEDDPAVTISHVQADVHAEMIDDPVEIADHLIEWIEQQGRDGESSAKDEVIQILLDQVVAVRLHIDELNVYQRVPMYEAVVMAS